jgi:hypothetical protein
MFILQNVHAKHLFFCGMPTPHFHEIDHQMSGACRQNIDSETA